MLFDYVFDLLFDDGADLRPQPLSDRGARLKIYLADHGPGDAARIRLFHSKALDTDDSFSFTFAKAGTYGYSCGLHPRMRGGIHVRSRRQCVRVS
jgi:hypothetical protein